MLEVIKLMALRIVEGICGVLFIAGLVTVEAPLVAAAVWTALAIMLVAVKALGGFDEEDMDD